MEGIKRQEESLGVEVDIEDILVEVEKLVEVELVEVEWVEVVVEIEVVVREEVLKS